MNNGPIMVNYRGKGQDQSGQLVRMKEGPMPTPNEPKVSGRKKTPIHFSGKVTAPPTSTDVYPDAKVTVNLIEQVGTGVEAIMLLPAEKQVVECKATPSTNDVIPIVAMPDGEWIAPGPFVTKQEIRETFACE